MRSANSTPGMDMVTMSMLAEGLEGFIEKAAHELSVTSNGSLTAKAVATCTLAFITSCRNFRSDPLLLSPQAALKCRTSAPLQCSQAFS